MTVATTMNITDVAKLMRDTTVTARQVLTKHGLTPHATVRVGGKLIELWDAGDATKAAAAYRKEIERRKLERERAAKAEAARPKRKYTKRANKPGPKPNPGSTRGKRMVRFVTLVARVDALTAEVRNVANEVSRLAAMWEQGSNKSNSGLATLSFDDAQSTGQGPSHGGHISIS